MNGKISFSLVLAASSVAASLSSLPASGEVLIGQDFENQAVFPAGTPIGNAGVGDASTTTGFWKASSNYVGQTEPTPMIDPADAGNHAVLVTRNGGAQPALVGMTDSAIASGEFAYEFDYYLDGNSSFLVVINKAGDAAVDLKAASLFLTTGAPLKYRSGASYADSSSASLAASTWYNVRVVGDLGDEATDTGTYSVYLNDAAVATDIAFSVTDRNALAGMNRISFIPQAFTGTGAGETFYVDDVLFEAVPEPGSMALAASGLLLMAMRRRR